MKTIISIVSTLITMYIAWLSYTVLELSKSAVLVEYKLDKIHGVLQTFSEEIHDKNGHRIIFYKQDEKKISEEIR